MNRPAAQCRRCSKEFVPIKPQHVYCDAKCRLADAAERVAAQTVREELTERRCQRCTTPFQPHNRSRGFCNASCRRRALNRTERLRRRGGVPVCGFCGDELGAMKKFYCGIECRNAARSHVVAGIRRRQLDLEALVVEQAATIEELRRRVDVSKPNPATNGAKRHTPTGPTGTAAALPLSKATDALWSAGIATFAPVIRTGGSRTLLQEAADGPDADGSRLCWLDLVAADDAERFSSSIVPGRWPRHRPQGWPHPNGRSEGGAAVEALGEPDGLPAGDVTTSSVQGAQQYAAKSSR